LYYRLQYQGMMLQKRVKTIPSSFCLLHWLARE
jgi:hypothetical protein